MNQPRRLCSLGASPLLVASPEEISKSVAKQHSAYAICFMKKHQVPSPFEQPELRQLIDQFSDLFE